MEENETVLQLRAENAQQKIQIDFLNKNLIALQQQNAVLAQQNGEMLTKLDLLLKTMDQISTKTAASLSSTSTGGFTAAAKSNKRRSDGENFGRSKNSKQMEVNVTNSTSAELPVINTGDSIEIDVDSVDGLHNLNTNDTTPKNKNTDKDSWANITSESDKHAAKPTPIQIGFFRENNFIELLSLIRDKFNSDEFEWIHLRKTAMPRIICINNEVKHNMMNFLRTINCEFNTYTDKNARRSAYIVRGLQYQNDNDNFAAIRDSMTEYGVDLPVQISRFTTPSMKRQENPNLLYQLVFSADAKTDGLVLIKNIDGFRVKIEKMIGSKKTQCRRCQRLSHVASSCSYKYRCVQCVNTHGPGQCPRGTNGNLPIGCINCFTAKLKYNDHTANDLVNCGFYKKQQTNDKRATNSSVGGIANAVNIGKSALGQSNRTTGASNNGRSNNSDNDFGLPSKRAANNSTISKRKQKKLVSKFRQSGESVRGANVTGDDSKLNINEKKKLFELFCNFLENLPRGYNV